MITILGPREPRVKSRPGSPPVINTCSFADDWTRGLSPFLLGPCHLYYNYTARRMENGWQYSKVYECHADEGGNPLPSYWKWARAGWASERAVRYPMGRNRAPLYSLWKNGRLGYIDARRCIYLPLYVNAVKHTEAFRRLQELYQETGELYLFDFDGYDERKLNMTLGDVLDSPERKMGHAFLLKILLIYGPDFNPDDLPRSSHPQ